MRWADNFADWKYLCLIWGSGTIIDCLHVSEKIQLIQILLSGRCLRNSLCISSGLTAELLDFFMESIISVRMNGLLYILKLAEVKFIFFFLRVYLILLNCMLNWLEEFLENVFARSAMAFFLLFSGLTPRGVLMGLVVFYRLYSESWAKLFWYKRRYLTCSHNFARISS